jgi:type-F conjugative transfer system pilin assembly protein TrbC
LAQTQLLFDVMVEIMKDFLFFCTFELGIILILAWPSYATLDIERYRSEALALEREAAAKIVKYQPESGALQQQGQQLTTKTAAKELGLPINGEKSQIEKYVFISFSMPDAAIKSLLQQAKAQQIVPILRGFKDNSYQKTFTALAKFVEEIGYGVSIDPELFAEFAITQVPTFVIAASKDYVCLPNSSCQRRKFYKIAGNTSAAWALEQLNAAWSKK